MKVERRLYWDIESAQSSLEAALKEAESIPVGVYALGRLRAALASLSSARAAIGESAFTKEELAEWTM